MASRLYANGSASNGSDPAPVTPSKYCSLPPTLSQQPLSPARLHSALLVLCVCVVCGSRSLHSVWHLAGAHRPSTLGASTSCDRHTQRSSNKRSYPSMQEMTWTACSSSLPTNAHRQRCLACVSASSSPIAAWQVRASRPGKIVNASSTNWSKRCVTTSPLSTVVIPGLSLSHTHTLSSLL